MKKKINFYTAEEKNIMKQMLSNGKSKMSVARELAWQFNRTKYSVYQKLNKLETSNVKLKPEELNFKPEIKQESAEIGIDVPHGMTFEGKPKRITLHSDHFRIYF